MYYECRKCNRRFDELKALGKVKFCGDFWKCTDCDHDITKDLKSWFKECNEMAKILWEATPLEFETPSDSYEDAKQPQSI